MNAFILCTDESLKQELLSAGFSLMKEESYGSIFAQNIDVKFNFSNVDKKKYTLTNKLTF